MLAMGLCLIGLNNVSHLPDTCDVKYAVEEKVQYI